MKNMIVVAIAGITLSATSVAYSREQGYFSTPEQYASANLEMAQKNYQVALKAGNNGLTESAIAQVAMLGIMAPERVSDQMKESVAEMVSSGTSASIRYEAYLTTMVLEHPSLFAREKRHTFADAGELFATIGNTLQRELIAGNARTAD